MRSVPGELGDLMMIAGGLAVGAAIAFALRAWAAREGKQASPGSDSRASSRERRPAMRGEAALAAIVLAAVGITLLARPPTDSDSRPTPRVAPAAVMASPDVPMAAHERVTTSLAPAPSPLATPMANAALPFPQGTPAAALAPRSPQPTVVPVMAIRAASTPMPRSTSGVAATPIPRPTPVDTRPLRIVAVSLTAEPSNYVGRCPARISFRGTIRAEGGGGRVSYRFTRSDGARAPVQTVDLGPGESRAVTTDWRLWASPFEGWQAIEVLAPQPLVSERASFRNLCKQ